MECEPRVSGKRYLLYTEQASIGQLTVFVIFKLQYPCCRWILDAPRPRLLRILSTACYLFHSPFESPL
jgi:hypothetical protein